MLAAEAADLLVEAEVRLELMLAAVAVDVAVAMEDAAAAEEDVEVVGARGPVVDVGPVAGWGVPDRKTAVSLTS
jgi:hypothetical protein